jgi:hypothetical protein
MPTQVDIEVECVADDTWVEKDTRKAATALVQQVNRFADAQSKIANQQGAKVKVTIRP